MKTILSFHLIASLAFVACNGSAETIKSFIPGKYVKFSDGEYSKAWDTLLFSVYNENARTYSINRRLGFQRIRNGKLQPKEYATETSVVVFHPTTFQLQNPNTGKLYTFLPNEGAVLAGSALYRKIE